MGAGPRCVAWRAKVASKKGQHKNWRDEKRGKYNDNTKEHTTRENSGENAEREEQTKGNTSRNKNKATEKRKQA